MTYNVFLAVALLIHVRSRGQLTVEVEVNTHHGQRVRIVGPVQVTEWLSLAHTPIDDDDVIARLDGDSAVARRQRLVDALLVYRMHL